MSQNPTLNVTKIVSNQTGKEIDPDKITLGGDLIEITETGDDKGVGIVGGQFSVGTPEAGQESVFGGGDSYPVPIAYHCTIANTTDLTITDAIDISAIAQSDNGSTVGLFNGVDAGNYILVGSDYKFAGTKTKINTAGTIEPENIIAEYLRYDIPTWIPAPFMATLAIAPYTQYGNVLTSVSATSEQWRFGFNPLDKPADWDKITLSINGEDITKYWARFRITSNITLDPVIEQIKLHTDRTEINADGVMEFFGNSRPPRDITIEKTANADKTPLHENIRIGVGITEVRTHNEFANIKSDGFIIMGVVPVGTDTSIPAQVIIEWYADTANAGDVELSLESIAVDSGFIYDGSTVPFAHTPMITSVDNQQYERQVTTFLIDISGAHPLDMFYTSLFRDATVPNDNDTLVGNIVISAFRVINYFWRP